MKNLLLFLTTCTALTYGQFPYDKPCRLTPNPGPSLGSTMTIHTNTDCTEGSVFWNYPQGNLRVVFERLSPTDVFDVCLTKDGGSYNVNRIIDVRTGTVIPKPIGRDECVRSQDGRVVLEFQSDRLFYYLAIIIYKIKTDFHRSFIWRFLTETTCRRHPASPLTQSHYTDTGPTSPFSLL